MSYIRGIKAYKIFNLLYLTKKKPIVKNYFWKKFLCLNYFSSLIFNKTDKGFDGRVQSFLP
jgi:hypothetical protein